MTQEKIINLKYFEKCQALMELIFTLPEYQGQEIRDNEVGDRVFFLHGLLDKVEKTQEYVEYSKCMENDNTLNKHIDTLVGIKKQRTRHIARSYMIYLIKQQLYYNKGIFIFDKDTFLKNYRELEDFFYSDIIKMRAVIKLINFKCNVDEIRITENIRIRKIDERDFDIYRFIRSGEFYAKHILEYFYEEKKIFGDYNLNDKEKNEIQLQSIENDEKIQGAIQTLRLLKKGRFYTGDYYEIHNPSIISVSIIRQSIFNPQLIRFPFYEFTKDDVIPLQELYEHLNKTYFNKNSEFIISLRRFNDSLTRFRYDDKLIDMVIAFEALLFKSGENNELLYRLKIRTAKLLRKEYSKRVDLIKKLTKIYKLRSSIVHGGKYKIDYNLIGECEDILRDALESYLRLNKKMNHEEIINRLDLHEII